MTEDENNDVEIKCIFCEKKLDKNEMVRFRGAIACRECTEKQKPLSGSITKPLYYLAGIGCLVGIFAFTYYILHGFMFMHQSPDTVITPFGSYPMGYLSPIGLFLAGITIAITFVSIGLYALNRKLNHNAAIVTTLAGLGSAVINAFSYVDYITTGPYFVYEEITYIKPLNYYSTSITSYSLFSVVVGISILLYIANTRNENISIAAAGLFLLVGPLTIFMWASYILGYFIGFIHVFAYSICLVFFVTRQELKDIEDITSLDYE